MRTRDPNRVIDAFVALASSSLADWTQLVAAAPTLTLARNVSRDAFFRVVVAFDAFRSDWHLACVNRQPGKLRSTLAKNAQASIKDRYGDLMSRHVRVELPLHLTVEDVRLLLDPLERHLSFGGKWETRSELELDPLFAGKVRGLSVSDNKLVDAAVNLRNLLAHGSVGAMKEARASVAALDPVTDPSLLATHTITPSAIARYLHTRVGGVARVATYHQRLSDVANGLRVP